MNQQNNDTTNEITIIFTFILHFYERINLYSIRLEFGEFLVLNFAFENS